MYLTLEKSPLKTPDAMQERIYTFLASLIHKFHQMNDLNAFTDWDYSPPAPACTHIYICIYNNNNIIFLLAKCVI